MRKSVLLAVLILLLSFVGFKYMSGLKQKPHKDLAKAKIVKVDVIKVKLENIKADIAVNGRLHAKSKIEIFTEVTGRLLASKKAFKSGVKYNKGELLLKLDDSNYRMTLNSNRSNFQSLLMKLLADVKIEYPDSFEDWEKYINNFDPEKPIPDFPEITNSKEKNFLVSKNVFSQLYSIKAQEAQLDKYTLYAPFTGVIKNANINPNSMIRAGQKIAEFINPNIFELEVGVSLVQISKINVGDKVMLSSNDIEGQWEGVIMRIGESVSEKTMNFNIYIEIKSSELYEGMYLKGVVSSFELENVAKIPTSLIVNGNMVYQYQDSLLHFKEVEIIHETKNYSLVRGLDDNTFLISHSIANAYEGMKLSL